MAEELGYELPDDQFARVAEVATRLIGQHGWRTISLREVAKLAGVGYPELRRAVLDEEGLLTLVLEHRDVADIKAVRALWDGTEPDPASRLHDLVAHNAAQPEIIQLYAVLSGEAIEESHPAYAYFRRRYQESAEIMADIVKDYVPDPEATGVQIMAMMDGLQLQWLRDHGRFDLVAEWDKAAAKILSRT